MNKKIKKMLLLEIDKIVSLRDFSNLKKYSHEKN